VGIEKAHAVTGRLAEDPGTRTIAAGTVVLRAAKGLTETMLRVFPDALAEYAHLGRSVLGGAGEMVAQAPTQVTRVGRNDPCPCGSGKKFKKCCGETNH
jgi:uncharacterized protein YecA (UPF0149 family)